MATAKALDREGMEAGSVELNAAVFEAPVNVALMHQALLRQLANARQGTADTKTRGEVSGGGRKPWKQKGTGRARQGSTRAPQWRHGGTVFGPHPRGYEQGMPRKARRAALRAALTARAQEGALFVLDPPVLEAPRTQAVAAILERLERPGTVLLVLPAHDLLLEKSARNIGALRVLLASNLNIRDVLSHDTVLLTPDALRAVEGMLDESAE
jgi:large subunit ribosomal protein L4